MPIFEYGCKACGNVFEFLKLPSTTAVPQCPECESQDLERLQSGFAVNSAELSRARVKAARQAFSQSKTHIDHKVSEAEHVRDHIREHMPPPGEKLTD